MKIKLLQYTDESTAIKACGICINKYEQADNKNLLSAVQQGHLSVLEHIFLSFYIEATKDTVCQMLRHRHFSFSEQSDRYVTVEKDDLKNKDFLDDFNIDVSNDCFYLEQTIINRAYKKSFDEYQHLLNAGMHREHARHVLPSGRHKKLIISGNLRAFIEMLQKRLCQTTQHEFRTIAKEIYNCIGILYGYNIGKLCLPNCKMCVEKYNKQCKNKVEESNEQ